MAQVKLSKGGFTLMREGEQVVKIIKAEGKPSGRPQELYIEMANEAGETIKNHYTLDGSNEKGIMVTSIFLKACLGEIEEFDTDDIPALEGKFIKIDVVHKTQAKRDKPDEKVTFANIGKVLGGAEPFAEVRRGRL